MPKGFGNNIDQEPNQAESNNFYYKAKSNSKLKGMSYFHSYRYSRKESHTEGCHVEMFCELLKGKHRAESMVQN